MSERPHECCCECGEPTGRAGRGDGSIYRELIRPYHRPGPSYGPIEPAGTEIGPLCDDCSGRLETDGLFESEKP